MTKDIAGDAVKLAIYQAVKKARQKYARQGGARDIEIEGEDQ